MEQILLSAQILGTLLVLGAALYFGNRRLRVYFESRVTCQVSALLKEVNQLIDKRRELRARTMDALHAEGIEIVSPSFMNTRVFEKGEKFIPDVGEEAKSIAAGLSADAIAFDLVAARRHQPSDRRSAPA